MHLINNQPWVDLESHIDLQGLLDIKKDIVLGMVKSKLYWQPGSADTSNFLNPNPPSLTSQCWPEKIRDPKNPHYEYYKELGFNLTDCLNFSRYYDRYSDMGDLLCLRVWSRPQDIIYKFSAEHCKDTPAYNYFPSLKKWIDSCTAFKEIGRIILWRNQAGQPGAIHRDTYLGSPDTFILFNLDVDRKTLFILDDEGKEIPITSQAFIFDPRNWHGTRGLDYAGWTLRIDGVFNDEWLAKTGLTDYVKQRGQHG
jgi:hypothetical protein